MFSRTVISFRWIFLICCLLSFSGAFAVQDTISSAGLEFSESAPVEDTVAPPDTLSAAPAATAVGADPGGAGLWSIFWAGVAGGFLAFFMPCIFPMVPLTVSFFTKRAETKGKGVLGAFLYGLSIIVIYVGLGLLLNLIFGPWVLNELSTDGYFNIFIFLVLFVFGLSFLGAFEINLPTSLANKLDSKADSKGLKGIFFMAATLAIVSFSCTGPIIGTVIVLASEKGQILKPAVGMLGFSSVLALIFTFFAIFPSLLAGLPKSGGWLNAVKVVLGFLELGLSLKFLSNADLAFSWGFLDREVFLALWIAISALMGIYLLGKLKLPHDSATDRVSVTRVILAIVVLAFTVYLIPGLWGAPLKAVSGLTPSMGTQDFSLGGGAVRPAGDAAASSRKYAVLFHKYTPYGIQAFYDYEEGLAYAKQVNKPVFLDFTGEQCVNCRKMEELVWSDAKVQALLKNDYVVISLFTDSKSPLPENEVFRSDVLKTDVNTIGKKFKHFQAKQYSTIAQPFYVLTDLNGNTLVEPQGADFDAGNYIRFLESGLAGFRKIKE